MEYLLINTFHTGSVAFLGFLLAMFTALFLVSIVVAVPMSRRVIYAVGVFWKVSPAVAYGALLLNLLGSAITAKVFTSALISFYPVMVELIESLDRAPHRLSTQAHLRNCSAFAQVRAYGWAYMLEGLTRGMLTACPLAVIGAIVADYVIGSTRPSGIGQVILSAAVNSNRPMLIQSIISCTVLGGFAFFVAKCAHSSVSRWLLLTRG